MFSFLLPEGTAYCARDIIVGQTVCLVGNGPLEPRVTARQIDANDVVIRFNNSRLGEVYGSKTTIYVSTLTAENEKLLKPLHEAGALIATASSKASRLPPGVDESWHEAALHLSDFLDCWPSSGLVALYLAIACRAKSIRIVGMDLAPSFTRQAGWRYNYAPPSFYHNFLGERRVLPELLSKAAAYGIPVDLPEALQLSHCVKKSPSVKEAEAVSIAAVVTTHDRPRLLRNRALKSIAAQTILPDVVIVVDDSSSQANRAKNREIVRQFERQLNSKSCRVEYLLNRRTPQSLSGATNTALYWLADTRRATDVVATLDDDDIWEPEYLTTARAAFGAGADIFVSGMWRHSDDGIKACSIPKALHAEDFLVGNPEVQGSNKAVRLAVLLSAGGFDEALPACTDRDLGIRLLDLPGLNVKISQDRLVHHYAEQSRHRLTSLGSQYHQIALKNFYRKWCHRMTQEHKNQARDRSIRLFAVDPVSSASAPSANATIAPFEGKIGHGISGSIRLDVGVIALSDDYAPMFIHEVGSLLADSGLVRLRIVILRSGRRSPKLDAAIEQARREGVIVVEAPAVRLPKNFDCASIAANRSALYSELLKADGPPPDVTWIADEDMRLDADVIDPKTGKITRQKTDLIGMLLLIKKEKPAIAIGRYTGAAPVPAAATFRTQLLDLLRNLETLANLQPDDSWPVDPAQNAVLLQNSQFYYDLAVGQYGHLESQMYFEPSDENAKAQDVFCELCSAASGIFSGVPLTRRLAIPAPHNSEEFLSTCLPSAECGGATFVFDRKLLRLPVTVPNAGGRDTRRGDMIWALRAAEQAGAFVLQADIPIRQERFHNGNMTIDLQKFGDDLIGHAVAAAVRTVFLHRSENLKTPSTVLTPAEEKRAWAEFRRALRERMTAFEVNVLRIRGIARSLEPYFYLHRDKERRQHYWWLHDSACSSAVETLVEVIRSVQREFNEEPIDALRDRLKKIKRQEIIDWLYSAFSAERVTP